MLVRGSRKRSKKAVATDTATAEISGIITDSVLGLPLVNVTINLVEHKAVCTTDADGYYLIDELEAGSYTLTCHTSGYDVPQAVTCEFAVDESLVIDFSLGAVVNPANN
jgi:hypothetical protein